MLGISDPPHVIHQDNFDPGKGNALQAAIASIFGLSLDQVPNFIEMPLGYEASICEFCQQGGIIATKVKLNGSSTGGKILGGGGVCHPDLEDMQGGGGLCVLRGKSPRGDHGHVVVARWDGRSIGFRMVHDPHPDGTFLDGGEEYGWCLSFRVVDQN